MVQTYIIDGVLVEAVQYKQLNKDEIEKFTEQTLRSELENESDWLVGQGPPQFSLTIETMDGDRKVFNGDWIIKFRLERMGWDLFICDNKMFKERYWLKTWK